MAYIVMHFITFVAIIYLLYSNSLQKIRTSRAIEAVGKFEGEIKKHFESVINHVASIKAAIQVMQLGAISINLQEGLDQPEIKVKKVSAEDPGDKIVSLGDLIPPK